MSQKISLDLDGVCRLGMLPCCLGMMGALVGCPELKMLETGGSAVFALFLSSPQRGISMAPPPQLGPRSFIYPLVIRVNSNANDAPAREAPEVRILELHKGQKAH